MSKVFHSSNWSAVFLALAFYLSGSLPASAHKIIAEVYVSGDVIEGEIGFSDGSFAADVPVEIFDGEGNKLGEAKTNSEGVFEYKVQQKSDHVFRANLGAGHIAEARVGADEITLDTANTSDPASTAPAADSGTPDNQDITAAAQTNTSAAPAAIRESVSSEQIARLVAEAVRKEVRPLQKELAAYREKNDFQSILGGIGYICGLFGIAYYIAGRQKNLKKS